VTSPNISATLILSVGRDAALLSTRDLLLQSAGYIVESSCSIEEATDRFRTGDFDLVILCHSIPERERQRLVQVIRDYGSATPVVFVSPYSGNPDRFSDLSIDNCPGDLLSTVHRLLSRIDGRA
jgi:CheY-like chemotaxis protein